MEPFIGQIMLFAGNFAPRNWAFCNGQLLSISQNQALFSIIGTIYGGDGRTTFALPDLRGRVPIHVGSGPGLTRRTLGQRLGTETNTLNITQMPPHNHEADLKVSSINATLAAAATNSSIASPGTSGGRSAFTPVNGFTDATPDVVMNSQSVQTRANGGGQSVNNMQPSLGVNYIIALIGVYPPRD